MHYIIVFDTETGGLKASENPMTEIALSVYDWKKFTLIESYQTFIKPYNGLIITDEALASSNVTMKQINAGVSDTELMKNLITLFSKYKSGYDLPTMVGHNTRFDMEFLEALFEYRGKNLYEFVDKQFECTQKMMKLYEGANKDADKQRYKLGICCERMGIKLKSAHGAAADVSATADLFKILMNKMRANKTIDKSSDGTSERTKSREFFELKFEQDKVISDKKTYKK